MNFYTRNKTFILTGIVSGILFALVMAVFDYFKDESFSLLKFAMHVFFFGLFNGYWAYRKNKKEQKSQNNSEN